MQYHSLTSKDKYRLFNKCKRCSICLGKSLSGRLVTDHCHSSGEVREVLCDKCNSWLGVFESTSASEARKNKIAKRVKRKYGIERFTFENYLEKYKHLKETKTQCTKRVKERKSKKKKTKTETRQPKYLTLPNDVSTFKPMVSVSLED